MTGFIGSIQILTKTDAQLIELGSPYIPLSGQPIKVSDTGMFCIGDGTTAYTSLPKISFTALTTHLTNTSNPHSVTKSQVGLGNADDTSDANKPVSTAQQTALDLKESLSNKDTDATFAANSDTKYPSQRAVKAAVFPQIVTSFGLNPTGGSQANKMMGLAVQITPAVSKRILVVVQGTNKTVVGSGVTLNVRYGTGTPPANGAAATGTAVGTPRVYIASTNNGKDSFSLVYPIAGLSIGTQYWVDVEYTGSNSAAVIFSVDVVLTEI